MRWKLSALVVLAALAHSTATAQAAVPLSSPQGIVFDKQGRLYVADYDVDHVVVYNSQLVQTAVLSGGMSGPNRLAFDTLGNLYVCNAKGNSITVYGPDGIQKTSKTITNQVSSPEGVAVDAYGDVFVANNGSANSITVYNIDGQLVETVTQDHNGRNFIAPGVVVIQGMNVYVGTGPTSGQSYVSQYNVGEFLTGSLKRIFSYFDTGDEGPTGIAFDQAGDLFVSDFYTATIVKYSPSGQVLMTISTGSCCQNQGVALDAQGNIYAAYGSSISVYSPTGKLLKTIH